MVIRMDCNKITREDFKKILLDLEDEHEHLKASVDHLKHEVQKRELEVQNLLVQRELKFARQATLSDYNNIDKKQQIITQRLNPIETATRTLAKTITIEPGNIPSELDKRVINTGDDSKFSSEFSKQVANLLDTINKTTEQVNKLLN